MLSLAALLMLAGCGPAIFLGVGAAAGVAGYKYQLGSLVVVYHAPYMETWYNVQTGLKEQGLKIEKIEHDLTQGRILAKRGDDTPVTLSLEYKSSKETEVVIRVGYFGDQEAAKALELELRKYVFKPQG
jgi:hypothetical protein